MKRISKVLLLALMVCTLFAGCSIETIQSKKEDSKYNFYYLNTNETALKSEPYEPKEETKEYMVKDSVTEIRERRSTGRRNQSSSGKCFCKFL